ncbi:MAG: pyruvate formate lyase activating enzyme [Thermoproteota archaeon]|nr:pyruvate formate lyase activating enzyme [Thermoproteota archaeon]
MRTIRIGTILDLSTVDWRRHTVFMVFCAGCNFRCPFCSNSNLLSMDSGGDVNMSLIEERLYANREFVDALGFTGGEPGLQSDAVIELCDWAKKKEFKIFLNTNGSNSILVEELSKRHLLDYVALDVKAPLRSKVYSQVAGLNISEDILDNIREVIRLCKDRSIQLETRTTIVPTIIDDNESIREIAKSVETADFYIIQEYFPFEEVLDERLRRLKSPTRERLLELAQSAIRGGLREVYIRTRQNGLERVIVDK